MERPREFTVVIIESAHDLVAAIPGPTGADNRAYDPGQPTGFLTPKPRPGDGLQQTPANYQR